MWWSRKRVNSSPLRWGQTNSSLTISAKDHPRKARGENPLLHNESEEKRLNNAQRQEVLCSVKINLEDFLFNIFIDLPQTLGVPINEMHDDILSCLLTEIAKTHKDFYVEGEEEE
jgi:hypothetical protein